MSENCDRPRVRIEISGGVAHVLECDDCVDLQVKDYDVDGRDADNLSVDENGSPYWEVW